MCGDLSKHADTHVRIISVLVYAFFDQVISQPVRVMFQQVADRFSVHPVTMVVLVIVVTQPPPRLSLLCSNLCIYRLIFILKVFQMRPLHYGEMRVFVHALQHCVRWILDGDERETLLKLGGIRDGNEDVVDADFGVVEVGDVDLIILLSQLNLFFLHKWRDLSNIVVHYFVVSLLS